MCNIFFLVVLPVGLLKNMEVLYFLIKKNFLLFLYVDLVVKASK